jgi:hypothetical protein
MSAANGISSEQIESGHVKNCPCKAHSPNGNAALEADNEMNPQVSPDGNWLAYYSDESGRYEIYVVPFPGPGGKSQISTLGGVRPVWSRTGRELFYQELGTDTLMAVDVAAGPIFRAGHPQALFKMTAANAWFDTTSDATRFLVERVPDKLTAMTTFVTITNWFDDLRRRVPVKK